MRVEGADAYRTLGAVGMCVNGIFLTISSWRLVNAARVSEYHWRESRVMLHITLFTFAMLEFLYQVSIFATEKYVHLCYHSCPQCIHWSNLLHFSYVPEYRRGGTPFTFSLSTQTYFHFAWYVLACGPVVGVDSGGSCLLLGFYSMGKDPRTD